MYNKCKLAVAVSSLSSTFLSLNSFKNISRQSALSICHDCNYVSDKSSESFRTLFSLCCTQFSTYVQGMNIHNYIRM